MRLTYLSSSHDIGNESNEVISHAFQLKQIYENKYYGLMNKPVKPLACVYVVSDLMLAT